MTKQEQVDKLIEAIELTNEISDDVDWRKQDYLRTSINGLRVVRDCLIEEMDKELKA